VIAEMDPTVREKYEFVPQAILKRSPAFFANRGIKFREGLDDLNIFQVAELSLENLPFALMRHEGTPLDETQVYLPNVIPIERLPEIINRILAEFDLSAAALAWRREGADTPF
jgi:hypothetical protein